MKFGHQLQTSLIKDWEYHYLDYERLKSILPAKKGTTWTEDEEQRFVKEIEGDLDNVFTFSKVKSQEIIQRIKTCEVEVNQVVARVDNPNAQNPTDDEFLLLEEDLSDVIADVHDLAKFTQLNYTGFNKIIKKHDKNTNWKLKPVFALRLKAKPFFKDNYDAFIVKLSKLYNFVQTRGHPVTGDSSAGGKQQNFVRQTTKYWVHPDNITEVKLIIMKHLPVLVFDRGKEWQTEDMAISSIYYDNPKTWELYEGRLKKTEGAEAIRIRWYGGMDVTRCFMERKTHKEDWTGEKSVKARFEIDEELINGYMAGKVPTKKIFEAARAKATAANNQSKLAQIDEFEKLAKEIQYEVIDRKYVPCTRSFYNRTAFQLPADARVRISLDTELTMIREDNLDGRQRSGKNWRRMDIGIDYPFNQLPPEDVEIFPYAVLEVKLQTQAGQEPPQWVRDLTASHLVEAVPKFSKFIHGTAVLMPDRIKLLPFWFPQMDVDIRKPVTHHFGLSRPHHSQTTSSTADDMEFDTDDEDEFDEAHTAETTQTLHPTQAVTNGASSASRTLHEEPNVLDIEERLAAPLIDQDVLYDTDDEEDDLEEAKKIGGWQYYKKLWLHSTKVAGEAILSGILLVVPRPQPTEMPVDPGALGVPKRTGQTIRFKAPKGKRIHVPVRVEPKVALATERTFLSWLEFSIIIGSIAATLINFAPANTALPINPPPSSNVTVVYMPQATPKSAWTPGMISALGFTIVAMLALLYSLWKYIWRVDRISKRASVNYHDWVGPTGLCLCLFGATLVSFGFRIFGWGDNSGLKG